MSNEMNEVDSGIEVIPKLSISLVPVVILVGLLIANVLIFKDDASYGPNQMALILSGGLSAVLGHFFYKTSYAKLEKGIVAGISLSLASVLILLAVGSLISLWILSGIVPAMIYYGLKLLSPVIFLPVACFICCIVSLSTGSSWSTTGTIGIAFMGIGSALGIPEGMVAGAVISGAYFGDKMSPLSDTTNLAAAMAHTELFTHIRHMVYTSGPAIFLALIGFTILGFVYGHNTDLVSNPEQIQVILETLDKTFKIGPHLFIGPLVVLIMVAKRVPALPAVALGALIGALMAPLFQWNLIETLLGGEVTIKTLYGKILETSYAGFSFETGNKVLDKLLNRGGMREMLNTVWLILCAMVFGGIMEATGMLQRITAALLHLVRGTRSLIFATLGSCIFANATASDQYLAIILPGKMFRKSFEDYDLEPKNLSRTLEDAGTVTSVLIPWNSGGAYNSSVLGVATSTYVPFCFFNLLSPIIAMILASKGWTIEKRKKEA